MPRLEIGLIGAGTITAITTVVWYVWQIFHMPVEERVDWHNLVQKKGSIWRNGANWLLIVSLVLLVGGYIAGA